MPAPGPLELEAKAREVLDRIVVRSGSIRGAGLRCGRSSMWIWRQLRKNKSVDLVRVAQVLGRLGVPPRVFLEEVSDALPDYDPVWLIEHFRPRGVARDPFLATLEERFRRLLDHPLAPGVFAARRQREIELIEEKSFFDRRAAKAALEILGHDLLLSAELAAAGPGLARGHLVDCARLLLVWGALRRKAGSREDAAGALALAYRFGVAAGDAAALGLFFQDAAQLLLELGQPGHSLRYAQAAARHFQMLRDRNLVPMALVQCSKSYLQLGQRREARLHAIAALRLAGREQWRIRSVAWIQLAKLATARADIRRALGLLERAKKNSRGEELKAFIHGRQAVFLVRLGRTKKAARVFNQALRYFDRHGRYPEIASFAADLAEALLARGRFAATLELVQVATPHFERLRDPTNAAALWLDLCALLHAGRRNSLREQVSLVREALAGAKGSAFRHSADTDGSFFPFFFP